MTHFVIVPRPSGLDWTKDNVDGVCRSIKAPLSEGHLALDIQAEELITPIVVAATHANGPTAYMLPHGIPAVSPIAKLELKCAGCSQGHIS